MNQAYQSAVEGINSVSYTSVDSSTLYWNLIFRALAVTNFSITNLTIIRTSSSSVVNAPMAWSDLLWKYHQHGRVLTEGLMNGILTPFQSTSRLKVGNVSTVPINSFDENKLIKTDIGEGELVSASFNQNNEYDMEVRYGD